MAILVLVFLLFALSVNSSSHHSSSHHSHSSHHSKPESNHRQTPTPIPSPIATPTPTISVSLAPMKTPKRPKPTNPTPPPQEAYSDFPRPPSVAPKPKGNPNSSPHYSPIAEDFVSLTGECLHQENQTSGIQEFVFRYTGS